MFRPFMFLAGAMIAAMVSTFLIQEQEQEPESKPQADSILVPANDENAIARHDFMRTKLMYSQNIFEGLTTGNFELIDTGIKEVSGITEAEKWVEIDDDLYRKLTEDFKTSVQRLKTASESRNIEATALRYYQMSTSCIDCHQHMRMANYEL